MNIINLQKTAHFNYCQGCSGTTIFKAGCTLVSLNGVSQILFMARRLQYLRMCSTWQKPCSGKCCGKPQ